MDLQAFLRGRATDSLLRLDDAITAAGLYKLPLLAVEENALALGILPKRYIRNCLSCKQQLRLLRSGVSIIGCGGLGGTVTEILARIGVGRLRLVDPDRFEEHNLNRQRFSAVDHLGKWKVEVAAEELRRINPAIQIDIVKTPFSREDIIAADVVVDALDSGSKRLQLAELCITHGKPLVHGAVREWYGQTGIQTETNTLFSLLYPPNKLATADAPPKVLAPTVTTIAGLQAAEVCKLLLDIKSPLTKHWLSSNLIDCDFDLIPF